MNITHNFTGQQSLNNLSKNQELAVMPAELATKLLIKYASGLSNATTREIVDAHIDALLECRDNPTINKAVQVSMSFIAERELIKNIIAGNWDAYKVQKEEAVPEQKKTAQVATT